MKIIVYCFLLLSACKAQIHPQDCGEAYKSLVVFFLTDTSFVSAGNILPYPGEKKTDSLPLILHIEEKLRVRQPISNFINSSTGETVQFMSCEYRGTMKELYSKSLIDSNANVYGNTNKHVMGTMTLLGIYTNKPNDKMPKIYFDVIRRSSERAKSQFNDIVEFSYRSGKWEYTGLFNYEKS